MGRERTTRAKAVLKAVLLARAMPEERTGVCPAEGYSRISETAT